MGRPVTVIAIIAISVLLVILLLSSLGDSDKLDLPQDNGTFTGFPVWHPPLVGYDSQKQEATALFSAFLMVIAGYFIFKWTHETPEEFKTRFMDKEALHKSSTIEFDRLLGWYSIITAITGFLYFVVDVGKLWVTVGVLHNAVEFTILFALHRGGTLKSSSVPAWLISYTLIAASLSLFLNWPLDGLWFKLQGLVIDFVLVFQFARIYCETRKGHGDETHQRLFDAERPRRSGEAEVILDDDSVGYFRPYYILLLVLGAFAHLFGNVYVTIWLFNPSSYLLFSFSYCVTFPVYAYFVYLDTHTVAYPSTQKHIILPDSSNLKLTLVILTSAFLSLLTGKISMLIQDFDEHN